MQRDGAVELDVVELEFRGFDFERRFFVEVAQVLEFGMAIERVVVEIHFGVERDQAAVAGDDAGIDFEQRRVRFDERAVERLQERHRRVDQFRRKPQAERELARVIGLKTRLGANRFAQNRFGMLLRDFFDFHAARGAGHEHRRAHRAVHEHAEVKLALDVEAFFDQQAADDAAFRAGLRRDELHAQDAFGERRRFVGGLARVSRRRLCRGRPRESAPSRPRRACRDAPPRRALRPS